MVKLKPYLKILLVYVTITISLMVLGYFLLPQRYAPLPFIKEEYQSNFLIWAFGNFDGEHYIRIARDGYQQVMGQSQYAFFPLFPILIRSLGFLLGGDHYLTAHLIVLFSLVGFSISVSELSEIMGLKKFSLLHKVLIFPGSIFLLSIYTEPLYLFFSTMVFLFAFKGRFGVASFFAALAGATRINGVFLAIFLAIVMWQQKRSIKSILAHFIFSLAGFLSYLLYLFIETGTPLAFFKAQSDWGKSTLTMPWDTATRYFLALTRDFSFDLTHLVVLVEVLVTLYLLLLLYLVIKRRLLSPALTVYCGLNLMLPLATGSLGSMARFGLLVYPLFIATKLFPKGFRAILYLVSVILAATGIILFVRGYWWA